MKTCDYPCIYAPCPQQVFGEHEWCFYHSKIEAGLLEQASDYLTPAELEATMNGRYRGDGRRIDQFTLDEPVGFQ